MRHKPFQPMRRMAGVVLFTMMAAGAAQAQPKEVRFDQNPARYAPVAIALEGKALRQITQGLVLLEAPAEYRVDGDRVLLQRDYALSLKGRTVLTLAFADGTSAAVTLRPNNSAPQTASVEFDPPGGVYNSGQRVILTSPAVDAKIRYTLDGSDPTERSRDVGYTTVFVQKNLTLKARAFFKGKAPSAVSSAVYRIEPASAAPPAVPEVPRDLRPGAGAYEVYVGTAFYMDELLDRAQWPYVAATADGLYHRFMGVDALGADGKKRLGAFFAGGKAILEGGLRSEEHIRQDEPWIADVKAMGLRPVATFVNGLNLSSADSNLDLTAPWQARIALNRAAGVGSYTMQAPHRVYAEGGWADARFERARRLTLLSDGTCADAPTYLFTRREESYRQSVYDIIRWTQANGKRFLMIVSPNEGARTFLRDTMTMVRELEDHDSRPDFYGVTLYGKRPLHLVPESVPAKDGRRGADTVTGAAYYLLKHARADGRELDLWIDKPGAAPLQREAWSESAAEATPLKVDAVAKNAQGERVLSLKLSNRSSWVDFIPVLRARTPNAPNTARFLLNGRDVSQAVGGEGYTFYREQRLLPGATQSLTVTLPANAPNRLVLELLPYPGSRFVRDVLVIER